MKMRLFYIAKEISAWYDHADLEFVAGPFSRDQAYVEFKKLDDTKGLMIVERTLKVAEYV